MCRINNQREIIALDRQGTLQERPESPAITPPGERVNTRYINSANGTSSKKDASGGTHTLHFRHTRRHRCVLAYDKTIVPGLGTIFTSSSSYPVKHCTILTWIWFMIAFWLMSYIWSVYMFCYFCACCWRTGGRGEKERMGEKERQRVLKCYCPERF